MNTNTTNTTNTEKKHTKKKITGIIAGTMAVAMLAVGSIAYFTDRVNGNTSVGVGNVKVSLTNVAADMEEVIAPGCIIPLTFKVSNTGTLAIDEREKIALSITDTASGDAVTLTESDPEFSVYKKTDVEEVSGYGYKPKSGAQPVGTVVTKDGFSGSTIDSGNRIIYQVEQYTLDGSDNELGDSITDSVDRDYVILFRGTSSNKYQNVTVTADILVEAKQHAYTDGYNNDWTDLQSSTVSFNTGTQTVVPATDEFAN